MYRWNVVETRLEHADGVPWWQADVPAPRHRCRAQSDGWRGVTRIQRCACGAVRADDGGWLNRNARGGAR